jgi:Domain of unknown function (DUF1839)
MSVSVLPQRFSHRCHPIHASGRVWDETNCYLDVIIELLHAFGHEPLAALSVTASTRWEGDQWTFCKFNDEDLRFLFGADIQELNPWHELDLHVVEQLKRGNPVLIEADSFYLPDTRGSSYGAQHVKTTIGVLEMATSSKSMRYLHGRGCYELVGSDYEGLWLPLSQRVEGWLPPFIERVAWLDPRRTDSLAIAAATLLRRELERLPSDNPVSVYAASLEAELEVMRANPDMDYFHRYAFATLRQLGACFELLASHVEWLMARGSWTRSDAGTIFLQIAQQARSLQFQLARAIARNRNLDLSPLDQMSKAWTAGFDALNTGIV